MLRSLLRFTKPTFSRFFIAAALSLVGSAAQAAPLTEAEAVRAALEHPALAELERSDAAQAEAEGRAQTRWSNPQLSYTREQLVTDGAFGEDYIGLSQTFDVSGRRKLAREAAERRVDAAHARADARNVELAADVRHRFYALLLAQRRASVLQTWRDQVQARHDAVAKREQAGDAAAYERLRLVRELGHIDAVLEREHAATTRSWAELRVLTGQVETAAPALDGALLPSAQACPQAPALAESPRHRAREAEAQALRLDGRVASRWWVPNPTVGLGYKGVEQPGGDRAHGLFVSVSMPLPAFDRGQSLRARSEAEHSAHRASAALALRQDEVELAAACDELTALREGVTRMQSRDDATSHALTAAAEAGYRGGEVSVLELVDAYRSATEAQLLRLELSMQAREAHIELRRRAGDQP